MVVSYSYGQQQNQQCKKMGGNFDHHGFLIVQSGAHRPIKHIKGFTRSHWMPPLGECLCCIAAMFAMLVENRKY
jgi:hypothetical protein